MKPSKSGMNGKNRMHEIPPLFKHQQDSIDRFTNIPQGLDLSDAGTGKTRTMIELFATRRRNGGGCALILAPKSLLEAAWADDFRRFHPELELSVIYARNRANGFEVEADVYVTNTDGVRWLVKQKPQFFARFDTLIVDEISAFKHRTSLRSRCLRKLIKYFPYRYGLTGTPVSNTILDIWHQAFVIDNGQRLGRNFFAFRQNTTYPVQVGPQPNMVKYVDKPGASTAVADLLSDISVRHKLEDCLDIPENHTYPVHYTLPPKQRKAYNQMEKHAILEVSENEVVDAVNAAALVTKLLQISSGTVYDESGSSIHIEDGRYQLIADLVAARAHSLVFFNWKHQAKCLEDLFKQREIPYCKIDGSVDAKDRGQIVRDFQQGYYQVCLAQPQSAAHGLTLTRATTAIWASPTYNLEHFLQGNRRIYRAGQDRRTETILVMANDTIEEKVYMRLQSKDTQQIDFLSILGSLAN